MARLPLATKSIVAGQESGRGLLGSAQLDWRGGRGGNSFGASAPSQNQVARLNSAEHTAMRDRR
jgi:hypothetical protein